MPNDVKKILFVCLGNICRSPAAEGVLRHMAKAEGHEHELEIASNGLGDWHIGASPDMRMMTAAHSRGIILSSRAKQFTLDDFDKYDFILAADKEIHHQLLRAAKTAAHKSKIHLINDFSEIYKGQDVPDPYYQGDFGFELVLDMIEDSCKGLLKHLFKEKNKG